MFTVDDLAELPLVADLLAEIDAGHAHIEPVRRAHEVVRRLITRMIEDVIGSRGD